MRPRVFPAEDASRSRAVAAVTDCFNEAAGIPRGRRRGRRAHSPPRCRFNEAAGIPRGRLDPVLRESI